MRGLGRSQGTNRKGVNPIRQLLGKDVVDQPLAIDTGPPLEPITDDRHVEMAFAASIMTGMAGMPLTVVFDGQFNRRQRVRQLALDARCHRAQLTLLAVSQSGTCINSHTTNRSRKKIHIAPPAWLSDAS